MPNEQSDHQLAWSGLFIGFVNYVLTLYAIDLTLQNRAMAIENAKKTDQIIKLLEEIKNDRKKNN